jgi:hypothetical protein
MRAKSIPRFGSFFRFRRSRMASALLIPQSLRHSSGRDVHSLSEGGLMSARLSLMMLVCFVAGCKGGCTPLPAPCGAPDNCPDGTIRACQGKCVVPLATGAPCNPDVDCSNPQVCDSLRDVCLPVEHGHPTCSPAIRWGMACIPGVDDHHCASGLFCEAKEDSKVDWPPGTPPGFCVFNRLEGQHCVGQATGRSLTCEDGPILRR